MSNKPGEKPPRILILASAACAYPGADHAGQIHAEYPTNTYVLRVPSPVIFPEQFYFRCFDRGIAGIIVMSCGHECPYPGAYERLSERISSVREKMRERGMDPDRIRLCAICTVCSRAYLEEIQRMEEVVGRTQNK